MEVALRVSWLDLPKDSKAAQQNLCPTVPPSKHLTLGSESLSESVVRALRMETTRCLRVVQVQMQDLPARVGFQVTNRKWGEIHRQDRDHRKAAPMAIPPFRQSLHKAQARKAPKIRMISTSQEPGQESGMEKGPTPQVHIKTHSAQWHLQTQQGAVKTERQHANPTSTWVRSDHLCDHIYPFAHGPRGLTKKIVFHGETTLAQGISW